MVDLNNQTVSDLSFNASPISGGALQEGLGLSAPSPAPKPEAQPAPTAPVGLTPEQTMQKSYEDVGEKQADILRQRTQGAAGAARNYASDIGDQYKTAEAQYQKPEQFKPTEEDAKSLMSLFGAISVMGAFMGGKGQLGGIGAMNAMSGMVNGYTQGRKDLFDREKAKYDAGMKVMQEHNNQIDRILKNGLEKAKVNYASAQAEVESKLGAMGADLIKAQARQSGLVETAKHFDQVKEKAEKSRFNEARIKNMDDRLTIANMKQNEAQTRQASLEKTNELRQKAIELKIQDSERKQTAATSGVGAVSQVTRLFGPDAASGMKEKEATSLLGKLRSIKATSNLIEDAQDPDIKFGELGRVGQIISANINRNFGKDTDQLDLKSVDRTIDNYAKQSGLKPTDKNVVFYKKAVFTALELEREARGGSILPVAVMKTLGPLLDPTKMNRQQFTSIFADRIGDVAKSTNLTQEQLSTGLRNLGNVSLSGSPTEPREAPRATPTNAPPANLLKEGIHTTFKNGDVWTLQNGVPTKINE